MKRIFLFLIVLFSLGFVSSVCAPLSQGGACEGLVTMMDLSISANDCKNLCDLEGSSGTTLTCCMFNSATNECYGYDGFTAPGMFEMYAAECDYLGANECAGQSNGYVCTGGNCISQTCDTDEKTVSGSSWYSDCYGSSVRYDLTPYSCDTAGVYSAIGVCAVGADSTPDSVSDVNCDTGDVCYDGTYMRTTMSYCANKQPCDRDVTSTYVQDGIVCSSSCVGSASSNCCTSTDCSGGQVCNANYVCETPKSCSDVATTSNFKINTAAGDDCMMVDVDGDVWFAKSLATGQSISDTASDDFNLKNQGAGTNLFQVLSDCSVKLRGSVNENQGSLSLASSGEFGIKNSLGTVVFKIDANGNMYSLGGVNDGCSGSDLTIIVYDQGTSVMRYSTNNGQTFSSKVPCSSITFMTISENGNYIHAACSDGIYRSTTGPGGTYTKTLTLSSIDLLSVSDSGQYGLVTTGKPSTAGDAYYTNNYGASWNLVSVADNLAGYVYVSPSGQYMSVADYNLNSGLKFYYSTNYGSSWSSKIAASGNYEAGNVVMSDNGAYWFIDSNRRGHWRSTSPSGTFSQVYTGTTSAVDSIGAISANGKTAVGNDGSNMIVHRDYFTSTTVLSGVARAYNEKSISDDGSVVITRDRVSSNSGVSFSQPYSGCFMRDMTSDGVSIICTDSSTGTVRLSQNSGATWSTIYTLSGINLATMSG